MIRNLYIILGDQLDRDSSIFDDFDRSEDALWMAEIREESTKVWSHKIRSAYFLSAMRHFGDELRTREYPLHYRSLEDTADLEGFGGALLKDLRELSPRKLRMVHPGEYGVLQEIQTAAAEADLALEILDDRHFLCSAEDFARHAEGRKQLRMEFFYREVRKKTGLLMEEDGKPTGGEWNYDAANRKAFPSSGPPEIPPGKRFPPDKITWEVMQTVAREFTDHPGDLQTFDWPVTPAQAEEALQDFIAHRLPKFGDYQDAMWTEEPFLFHARLSCALNVKLIHPLTVCREVEAAWRKDPDRIPLEAVEGFIRQIIGWREYVRGIYWHFMPEYLGRNTLGANLNLPDFYWTGNTEMACLRDALGQTLKYGYAHHIQRLMLTGLFSLLLGVDPRQTHEWYLAVYLDAVEWVELPNTLGMSQYADDGVMASKPYIASGQYINRMSNYCKHCKFRPDQKIGEDACPFTTLYWDFLIRHRDRFAAHPRMKLQVRNLDRLSEEEMGRIQEQAHDLKQPYTGKSS
ncbi:MAG: cryptochrome/photolyase family protein [Verrucomicrobia bacterium]|nr:cryptochrome/photolyase family protein [Verrucomicrobiota bacterium]